MAHTGSPALEVEPSPAAGSRDVRVVTPDQLVQLRREQREIYQSLRQKGFGPSQAAREIGIPSSLADEWEHGDRSPAPPIPAPEAPDPVSQAVEAVLLEGAEIRRLAHASREARDAARQARVCAERLERQIALLQERIRRLQAAAGTTPPSRRPPRRAVRSSLTRVLLARGRSPEHPAPAPRS